MYPTAEYHTGEPGTPGAIRLARGMGALSACITRLDCIMYGVQPPNNPNCAVYPYACSDGSGKCYTRAQCEEIKSRQPYFIQGIIDCSNHPATCGGSNGNGSSSGSGSSTQTQSKCQQAGGVCIDTGKQTCSKSLLTGYCPGGSNIRCCTGSVYAKKQKSSSGGKVPSGPPTPAPPPPSQYIPEGVTTAGIGTGGIVALVLIGLAVSKAGGMW